MLDFDKYTYRYPSRRNVVYGKNAMVHSSMPVASQIGIGVMRDGGNAVDAALAMASALPLLEPTGNGIGGDCFALIWYHGKLYGVNGSGVAPKRLSAELIRARGYEAVPEEGWLPTMVPGGPAAWSMMRRRFCTMSMKEIMTPAIRYAEEGFAVSETVSKQWEEEADRYTKASAEMGTELFQPWFDIFTKEGQPYQAGEIFRNPDMAKTLSSLADSDCDSLYRGELMQKIVSHSKNTGGLFQEEDFTNYEPSWVTPIKTEYSGYEICELPPNGHGITVLMAMNILRLLELKEPRDSVENYHAMIEAIKLAFTDAKAYVSDPRTMSTKVEDMLSMKYAAARKTLIGEYALQPEAGDPSCGGTVYFCTADPNGNMVSFIQSNYARFGSGIVVPGTGITLQNRGANFSMDPSSDNYVEGGKRAYHTIIPGFLMKNGQAVGPFGVMGGFMQPQGHVQVLVNAIDFHMNPQQCLDAPRFQWCGEKKIQLEKSVPEEIAKGLLEKGHRIEIVEDSIGMGRGGIIWRMDNGVYAGGTESRCDGSIAVL